ncbi:hypothetical protein SAMN05421812_104318 [Asanoa hainanensis]|uniref:Uncharacterized protein n=1 Tax=Asanoa hainanensis TaxID=560556 RepID=A0A239LIT5_9ACTN|nr:hypothetical protein [Asanoa hainanensis]SNT29579.1 hypothetical protein SAMN05421812_104318 [Asanoa hainanensis]
MQTVLELFYVGVPRAAAIWSILLCLALFAITGLQLVGPRGPRRPSVRTRLRAARIRRERRATAAAEVVRFADEVGVAADRADTTARRRHEAWLTAQEAAERAWSAFESADQTASRMAAAALLPAPTTPQTPTEYAEREQWLHRAAMSACAHNELSVLDLNDALAHRNGWDPRRHPVEQEAVLRRAIRDTLRAAERHAAREERLAWEAAESSAAAARSLRAEAIAAAERARGVRHLVRPDATAGAAPRRHRLRTAVAR